MSKGTLADHIEKFSKKERAVLCYMINVINQDDDVAVHVHLGLLPFIKSEAALDAVLRYAGPQRLVAVVAEKLKRLYGIDDIAQMEMYLSNTKVIRRFGQNPERGHIIQYAAKKRVTVGVKWSLPHKDYIPDDDVLVAPHVTLKNVGGGRWRIRCESKYADMVQRYLMDHCI
jgi:hypothetical protein